MGGNANRQQRALCQLSSCYDYPIATTELQLDATIKEHKFSLRSVYDITSDIASYTAQKAFVSLLANLEVRTPNDRVVATIHGNFSLFRANYDFALADGRNFHYACEKFWRGVYSCIGPSANYHLFQHKGVRYSIFQDDKQIAALTSNQFIVGNGREYDVQMNHDADLLVITCMVLAINTEAGDDKQDATFTYDFGNFGPEDRKFDESWQPN
jgi:hypothetical protein